jgi:zinc transporter ZupT
LRSFSEQPPPAVLPEGFAALYGEDGPEDHTHARYNEYVGRVLFTPPYALKSPYPDYDDMASRCNDYHSEEEHREVSGASYAGLVILAGFLIMMTFDVWHDSAYTDPTEPGSQAQHQKEQLLGQLTDKHSNPATVVIGLLIHSAADGLALGVASASPSEKLTAFVGLAMVLHKGPVSFGLGAFLVGKGVATSTVILVRA